MAIFRCVVSGTYYNQLWQNVLHIRNETGLDAEAMATFVNDKYIGNIRNPLPSDVIFLSVFARNLSSPLLGFTLALQNRRGAQLPDDQLHTYVSWKLLYRTPLLGRKFRGRSYIPGVLKGFHQNGVLNQAGANQWAVHLDALRVAMFGGTAEQCQLVIHGAGAEPHDTLVTSIQLSPTTGVMGRRNIGRGI